MSTTPSAILKRDLESAWMVLRLTIRNITMQYAPRYMDRANTLSGQAMDPELVQPIARLLSDTLAKEAKGDEQSPTVRFLKNAFQPSEAEKERRHLEKAFNSYLSLWRKKEAAQPAGAPSR